jgi:hypothetical protein
MRRLNKRSQGVILLANSIIIIQKRKLERRTRYGSAALLNPLALLLRLGKWECHDMFRFSIFFHIQKGNTTAKVCRKSKPISGSGIVVPREISNLWKTNDSWKTTTVPDDVLYLRATSFCCNFLLCSKSGLTSRLIWSSLQCFPQNRVFLHETNLAGKQQTSPFLFGFQQ